MAILLNALKERNLSFDPSGYNPSPVAASKTRAGEIPNYSTEVQLEKAASAVGKNNAKAQNLENEKNGMVGGVLPVTGIGTDEPLRFGNQVDIGDVANQVINEKVADSKRTPSVPTATPTEVDIQKLTDKLRADQEAERAKFERKRMADRISRMGFALGNLIGAKGGSTDASAITLDDGTKTVNEYRKDMEDINKENQAAYQRALDLIYRKEDQDYKNAVLAENIRNHEATLAATQEWRESQNAQKDATLQANIERWARDAAERERANKKKENIAQQNANTSSNRESRLAGGGGGKTNQKGTQTVTQKTDKDGNKITTVTTRMPYNGKNRASGSLINFGKPTMLNF